MVYNRPRLERDARDAWKQARPHLKKGVGAAVPDPRRPYAGHSTGVWLGLKAVASLYRLVGKLAFFAFRLIVNR